MKLLCKNNLKYLIIFLLPVVAVLFLVTQVDNDSWYVLAEGREVVEHGVYHKDMLSMHGDFDVTVQNYGFAAIYWLIYSALGLPGLYIGMLVCLVVIEVLLYKIYMLMSEKNGTLSLILMTVTSLVLAVAFVVTRAQMVSFVIFLTLIYLLELYVKNGRVKYLYVVPFLSLVQINLHASLWLMLFLVMGVFVLDAVTEGRKVKPIIITGVVAAAVGLINPYGVEMIWFVVRSYIGGGIQKLVTEMQPFSLANWRLAVIYAGIAMAITLGFYGDKKDLKARYLLLFLGLLALGLNTLKGMSQVILVMFLPTVAMYKKAKFPKIKSEKRRKLLKAGEAVLAVVIVGVAGWRVGANLRGLREGWDDGIVKAVDKLDEEIAEGEREGAKVYSGFNDGGYLEFRGYKPYLDPRAEVFLETNNGKEDILVEWMELADGEEEREKFLDKYEFEYIVARGDSDPLYREKLVGYEVIWEDKKTETRVFKKSGV